MIDHVPARNANVRVRVAIRSASPLSYLHRVLHRLYPLRLVLLVNCFNLTHTIQIMPPKTSSRTRKASSPPRARRTRSQSVEVANVRGRQGSDESAQRANTGRSASRGTSYSFLLTLEVLIIDNKQIWEQSMKMLCMTYLTTIPI